MATKNISITEEAYDRLRSLGKENESFSEIIGRITRKVDWNTYTGILSPEAAEELESTILAARKRHTTSRAARIKRIVGEINSGMS